MEMQQSTLLSLKRKQSTGHKNQIVRKYVVNWSFISTVLVGRLHMTTLWLLLFAGSFAIWATRAKRSWQHCAKQCGLYSKLSQNWKVQDSSQKSACLASRKLKVFSAAVSRERTALWSHVNSIVVVIVLEDPPPPSKQLDRPSLQADPLKAGPLQAGPPPLDQTPPGPTPLPGWILPPGWTPPPPHDLTTWWEIHCHLIPSRDGGLRSAFTQSQRILVSGVVLMERFFFFFFFFFRKRQTRRVGRLHESPKTNSKRTSVNLGAWDGIVAIRYCKTFILAKESLAPVLPLLGLNSSRYIWEIPCWIKQWHTHNKTKGPRGFLCVADSSNEDDDYFEDNDGMFSRLEETRARLESELGCDTFLRAYKTVQVNSLPFTRSQGCLLLLVSECLCW